MVHESKKIINWITSKPNIKLTKDSVKNRNRHAMDGKKIFANQISHKVLVSEIYKELSKLKA